MSEGLLQTRAMFAPETINVEERTVELVWTTGAQVRRASWSRGDYIEELSLQPGAVRLDRLNKGGPLLDAHDSYSLRSQIGVVQRAWLNGTEGRALVKFSRRDDVEPIFQDVIDGIYRNVSVGYKVHKTERNETGAVPVERAVDWEPYELSLVPIPADAGAQVRSEEPPATQPEKERSMTLPADGVQAPEPTQDNETRAAAPAAAPAPVAPAAPAVNADEVRAGERRRVSDILDACRKAGLDGSFAEQLITDGTPINDARAMIIDKMAERQASQPQTMHGRVEVVTDHGEKRAEAMLHALEARSGMRKWDEGGAREYLGTTLLDMARECVERSGVSTKGMSKEDLAGRAMHSTTDFPLLLTSIQRVTLKGAYEAERQTWRPLAEQRNLPDFRDMKEIEVGGQMLPEELKEQGEYKSGTVQEQGGSWKLTEYGKKVLVGRRLIINDNLGYITRIIQVLGRGVATFEANMMWALITSNAKCTSDGKALFHADHNNTGTGVIGVPAISEARQKMRNQKDFTGKNPLYVEPRYILLPTVLETTFEVFNSPFTPTQTSNANPFTGKLTPIVEPRLDASSLLQYYIVGDYPGVDKLVYGYLEGEGGPSIESVSGRDPDGVTTYLRHSFGAHVPQHQAFYRSSGVNA
jgi:hypothetical protein